jgi:hypothetical protein
MEGIDIKALGLVELDATQQAELNGGISWGTLGFIAGGVALGLACMPLAPIAGVVAGAVYALECAAISEG